MTDVAERRRSARARTEPSRRFTAEGIVVSLAGWLLGIPIGYALARMFIWLLLKVVKLEFAFTFPPVNLLSPSEGRSFSHS